MAEILLRGFCICGLLMVPTCAVQINYIKVPIAVKNNSHSPVILDCHYSLRPDEFELVVKWFFNEDLVYQWIPSQMPQSFGIYSDRLDLSYKSCDDPKCVHRAMYVLNPTTDIAGEYKCHVSTLTDEDFAVKNMTVFVPETALEVYYNGFDESVVNFTCLATQVFPVPRLQLFKYLSETYTDREKLHEVRSDILRHPDGRVSTYIVASASTQTLELGSIIRCELRIPGTGYVKIKSFLYYPESEHNISQCCLIISIVFMLLFYMY